MKTNAKRQTEIMRLITEEIVETQNQLRKLLADCGITATQATISRDIKELGLIKELTADGAYHYVASGRKLIQGTHVRLKTIFREGVTHIDCAGNIVVIKTMPGLASAAAAALDSMGISEMVGSLAGDDTAIIIMRNDEDAASVCKEMHNLIK